MSEITVSYVFSDMNDLANFLEERAQEKDAMRLAAKTKRVAYHWQGERDGLQDAAEVVRASKLSVAPVASVVASSEDS